MRKRFRGNNAGATAQHITSQRGPEEAARLSQ